MALAPGTLMTEDREMDRLCFVLRRKGICWGILLFLLLVTAGCSTIEVGQDYRLGTNFSHYHTYGWKVMVPRHSANVQVNNPLLQERFRNAINQVLAARGFTFSAKHPDFLVSYDYSIATRLESFPDDSTVRYGYGRYYRYGGIGFQTVPDIQQYDVGTLVINIYNSPSGAMIWRGTGSQIVTTLSTPQESVAFAYRLVSKILAQFPPH